MFERHASQGSLEALVSSSLVPVIHSRYLYIQHSRQRGSELPHAAPTRSAHLWFSATQSDTCTGAVGCQCTRGNERGDRQAAAPSAQPAPSAVLFGWSRSNAQLCELVVCLGGMTIHLRLGWAAKTGSGQQVKYWCMASERKTVSCLSDQTDEG